MFQLLALGDQHLEGLAEQLRLLGGRFVSWLETASSEPQPISVTQMPVVAVAALVDHLAGQRSSAS